MSKVKPVILKVVEPPLNTRNLVQNAVPAADTVSASSIKVSEIAAMAIAATPEISTDAKAKPSVWTHEHTNKDIKFKSIKCVNDAKMLGGTDIPPSIELEKESNTKTKSSVWTHKHTNKDIKVKYKKCENDAVFLGEIGVPSVVLPE